MLPRRGNSCRVDARSARASANSFRGQQGEFSAPNEAEIKIQVDRPFIRALDVENGCLAGAQHSVDDVAYQGPRVAVSLRAGMLRHPCGC